MNWWRNDKFMGYKFSYCTPNVKNGTCCHVYYKGKMQGRWKVKSFKDQTGL